MSTKRVKMSFDEFAECFTHADGVLYRDGKQVGHKDKKGYLKVTFKRKPYFVHRVIFLLEHKSCPDFVDHIDGNKQNNKIENLRAADISTNHYNCKKYSTNKSGVKGVYWHKSNGKWACQLSINNQKKRLGFYDDFELAELVITEARSKFHGAFANHGEIK